ncbi:hypothetical protein BH24ACT15_BH24ACT15_39310 [soil metagenome]
MRAWSHDVTTRRNPKRLEVNLPMAGEGDVSAHQAAFSATRTDRDRTLQAIHRLETALAMASPGKAWHSEVTGDLEALEAAMVEERRELNRPDALLAMITAGNPRRFGPRARNLREQYDDIIRQVASLRDQLAHADLTQTDAVDVRQRAGWITGALHHCRARQTDLVCEALNMDLGER